MNFKELMQIKPKQWGLRGDPYLWDEISEHLQHKEVPKDQKDIEAIILRCIEDIIGCSTEKASEVFVERYSQGGMSSGVVSIDFWLNKALPFLIENYLHKQQESCFRNMSFDITTMYETLNDNVRINRNNDSIKIEVLSIDWSNPDSPITSWSVYKQLPLDCKLNVEVNALLRSKYFGYCESCNSYKIMGHMDSKNMCQCCANFNLRKTY